MTATRIVSVNGTALRDAFEFVSAGAPSENGAYVCVDTGKIYWTSIAYTPTPREAEKPPCQASRLGFYGRHDPTRLPGQRIAQRPDRTGSGRVGRASPGPARQCAGAAG